MWVVVFWLHRGFFWLIYYQLTSFEFLYRFESNNIKWWLMTMVYQPICHRAYVLTPKWKKYSARSIHLGFTVTSGNVRTPWEGCMNAYVCQQWLTRFVTWGGWMASCINLVLETLCMKTAEREIKLGSLWNAVSCKEMYLVWKDEMKYEFRRLGRWNCPWG